RTQFLCEIHACREQCCPANSTGADMVFPRDPFTGFLSGLLVVILSTSRRDRARVLISMKSISLFFSVVLLAHQKLFLFWGQVPTAKLMFTNPDKDFLPRFQIQVPNAAW